VMVRPAEKSEMCKIGRETSIGLPLVAVG
jgi:hypothetical protein